MFSMNIFELNILNRIDLILGFEVYCKIWNYSNYYGHNLNMDHCEYDPNKTQAKSIKST